MSGKCGKPKLPQYYDYSNIFQDTQENQYGLGGRSNPYPSKKKHVHFQGVWDNDVFTKPMMAKFFAFGGYGHMALKRRKNNKVQNG